MPASVNYIYIYASRMHVFFGEQSILRNLELCMEYRSRENMSSGFKTRSDTRRTVKPQKLAASQVEAWRFHICTISESKPLFIRIARFI